MRRAAAGLAALSAVSVLAGCSAQAVRVPAPEPDAGVRGMCRALVARAPERLFDRERVEVRPETPFAAAWGDPPIALRCGVRRPDALQAESELTVVEEIAWLPEPPDVYTAVGREAYVELIVPPSYGAPAPGLVEIGGLVSQEIPALPSGEL